MINSTLVDLRKSSSFFETKDIISVLDGRKKKLLGYFVPKFYEKEFALFLQDLEKNKRIDLLKKVSIAQKKDPIEDGSSDDGIR